MDIKINDKTYEVPDLCPTNAPKKVDMKRHLDQHGVESLLASTKYGQYASCILDELVRKGAQAIETVEVSGPPREPNLPVTQLLEVPGDTLGSPGEIFSVGGGETFPDQTIQGDLPQPDSEATP